ncbi:hypothetical protein AAZV13_06G124600 [Glycine max]
MACTALNPSYPVRWIPFVFDPNHIIGNSIQFICSVRDRSSCVSL